MSKIQNESEYNAVVARIEELIPLFDDDTPVTDKNLIEFKLLADLVEEYEDVHYPISSPSLVDILKLRMYERGLTQTTLAKLLGVSKSRISNYLTGKSEPTLTIAREMSRKLDIEPSILLGL